MISRMYGVRTVRYCPGSAEARDDSLRCRSAHSDTVRSGSGRRPASHARRTSCAPSKASASASSAEIGLDLGEVVELGSDMRLQSLLHRGGLDDDFLA